MRRLPFVAVIAVTCCGGPVRETLTLDEVCVLGDATRGAEAFSTTQSIRVSIGVNALLRCRPSCDSMVDSACEVTREGNTLRVRGRIVVDVDCHGTTPPPSCSIPHVECVTPPLERGEYIVTDGTRTVTFSVPSRIVGVAVCAR
jgi:hypothetical protein